MRVLIVEDEVISSMYLEDRLRFWGHEVAGLAATGEEAIECAAQNNPDIILMDISLAGKINGIEAYSEIRKKWPIPVIFMTGYDTVQFRSQAEALQPSAYMIKPLNLAELKRIIDLMSAGAG